MYGACDPVLPLSDRLLIELRSGGVRPDAGLEQRPAVPVRLDSSAVGKETVAAYAVVATRPGFAEQLRQDATAAQVRGRYAAMWVSHLSRARCGRWGSRLQGKGSGAQGCRGG